MSSDPEAARVEALRAEFPVLANCAYLNAGTAGPLRRGTAAVIAEAAERQVLGGRASFAVYMDEYLPARAALRAAFARLLGAAPDEVAITHHTSEGMNIAIWGLNWQPGDEVVVTSEEHEGGLLPVYAVVRRFGLTLRVVDVGSTAGDVTAALAAALTPRTRLVVVSHVTYSSGAVLPLAEVVRVAHAAGALVAVDGAQSAGAIPLALDALGVDFYAVPAQKWLCGPEGLGALYVRRDRISLLAPTFIGFFGITHPDGMDLSGSFMPAAGAVRYEQGTVYWPAELGLVAHLAWLEEEIGYPWIYARTQAMTARCRTLLAAIPEVTIHSPAAHAGLTTLHVAGLDPQAAVDGLVAQGVIIRSVPHTDWLRVSTGFFTDEADLQRLCAGLRGLLRET